MEEENQARLLIVATLSVHLEQIISTGILS